MSDSYQVNNRKRPKTSSPSNKSFVSSVTSQVTRFLPSTLTKWFGQSSNANGSATLAESTDSSTEDEATERPITTPPAKRMRYSPSAKNSSPHYTPISTKTSSTNTDDIEPFITAPSTSDRMFRRTTNLVSSSIQQNDESTVSTNDSKVNNYDLYKSEVLIERKRKSIFDKTQDSDAIIEDAVARSASAKVVNLTQPYFKAGLLSSPFYSGTTSYGGAGGSFVNRPNVNSRRKTIVKEPSTTSDVSISYSSRRVLDLLENYSSPLTEARRIPSYSTPTTRSLQEADTRKIKNTSYKMQELHVPQIASIIRLKQKQLMDSSNAARQIIASLSSTTPYPQPQNSPTRRSQSAPEKEKLTTKIKSMLTRTNRKSVEESPAPPTVNLPAIPLQIEQDKLPQFSFNSNSTITSSSSTDTAPKIANTQMSVINNAKDVTMNLPNQKTMSSVDRTNRTENSYVSQFKFSSPVEVSIEQSTSSTAKFSFGSPEKNLDSVKVPSGFTFLRTESQPKTFGDKTDSTNMKNDTCKECSCNSKSGERKCAACEKKKTNSIDKLPISNTLTSDKWKCSDCWVENEKNSDACVCCGAKKSRETTNQSKATESAKAAKSDKWKCSDCWVDNDSSASKCVCCGANKTGVKSSPTSTSAQTNKWRCKDCWVENDTSAQKCVCCGSNKSGKITSQPIKPAQTAKWKCKDCWVENDSSVTKCACCGWVNTDHTSEKAKTNSLVTSTEQSAASSIPKTDSKSTNLPLQSTIQSQSDKWECPICLVRNENNRVKCVCCEAEKPGTRKQPEIKFSFKDNPGALFKFGIPTGLNQDTNVQVPAIIKETPAKESEANNNVLPKATFSFGIPKSTPETVKPVDDSKKDEPVKPTFTFGINKSISTSTTVELPKPLFGLPKTSEVVVTSSTIPTKPVVTSEVQPSTPASTSASTVSGSNLFASPVTTPISIASNLFAPPVTTQSENKTSTPSLSFLSSPTTTISASSSNVLSTSVPAAAPTSTLSFSTGINTGINLFASPISQVTTASSTFPSVTAATTSNSLFSKSEPVNTAPISLFQKSESAPVCLPVFGSNTTTTTTAVSQLPTTSAAPVFCFSNTSNNSAPSNEKPKFNFKFGGSSANETPMFKAFGATSESNKFTLPTSNTHAIGGSGLSTGTTSTSSALPGINGLPTGNTLLGGDIGGNQQTTGNALSSGIASSTAATGLFGNPMSKVNNIWSANSSAASTPTQFENRSANFTFGSSNAFNSNASSTFGAPQQPQQPSQNLFGITNPSTNSTQPTMFSNTAQSPAQSNIFGNLPPSNVPLFGTPNISNPTFGTSTPLPTFETPATAAPTPSFNFGTNTTSGVFGFSQQQQPQQQTGIYNFGSGGTTPQVQFNMGSAPAGTAVRRVRKAIRRTQR
ncbi:nuclear pore complex protein Nup153 [Aricia agestis]|uniref:nuclear pore complex protein Nup153 n=1 Tax=Aricia agestis TaxID=91739 RepID=UPI001C205444|nr:nuclear pore complex protein Nup153 [Aricia agestis]